MKNRETGKNSSKIIKLNNKFVQKHHILAYFLYNKRDFSAKSPLLLLALRPRLFNFVKTCGKYHFFTNFHAKFTKNTQKSPFSSPKIVDASTILIGILSLFGTFFVISPVSAASLTLTLPTDMSLSVSADRNNGYGTKEGTIKVETDAMWGYTLGIKAKDTTNGNTLMNGSHKLPSISQSITDYQGSGAANTWAYKPSKKDSTTNNNFLPGPSTTGDTIEKTSTSNAGAATDYTITMAAKVNSTLPSGKYQNTFVISAVANAVSYTINYNPNNGSWSEANKQEGSTLGNKFTISSTEPNRTDYKFMGWCDQITSDENCGGKTYTKGEEYTIASYSPNVTLNLYAMWKDDKPTMDKFTCNLTEGETTILTDKRDGNTYKVAKLKDGKCWMIENLRLGDSKLKNHTLTKDDTDITANTYNLPNSSTSGFSSNTAQNIYVPESDSGNVKKVYGGYYTWMAATAGTGGSSGNASSSICPKGWRLPTGGSNGEFQNMASKYNNNSGNSMLHDTNEIPGFYLAGYYYSSSPRSQGSNGYYWSSTADNSSSAYLLYLASGGANPSSYFSKNYGFSIRCVAREKTMQNVSEWGSDVKEHEIVTAKDERDGNTYKVTRLKDGKLWMIDNLRLGDSKLTNRTLTSSNTDITASSYTLPNSSTSGFSDDTAQNIYVPDSASGDYKVEYGGYYTWMAATAGTGSSSGNASSSICPKGWRLPTGGSSGEFQTMASKYNDNSGNSMLHDTNEIPGFYRAGYYRSSSPSNPGSGYYWSSTTYNSNNAYYLSLSSGNAGPTNYNLKILGVSIRCVAK